MKNQYLQDLEDLKVTLDLTLVQFALTSARLQTLQAAILGISEELFPDEAYKNLCRNYLSELEQNTEDALSGLEGVLFEPGSKVLKARFEAFSAIQQMKRNLGLSED